VDYPLGGGARSLALGDVNADGRLDVVTANPSVLTVQLNACK